MKTSGARTPHLQAPSRYEARAASVSICGEGSREEAARGKVDGELARATGSGYTSRQEVNYRQRGVAPQMQPRSSSRSATCWASERVL